MGGGWCWDEVTCAARYANSPSLMSSKEFPEERVADGVEIDRDDEDDKDDGLDGGGDGRGGGVGVGVGSD
eukprot:764470-Hanusia_phi.AAC.5